MYSPCAASKCLINTRVSFPTCSGSCRHVIVGFPLDRQALIHSRYRVSCGFSLRFELNIKVISLQLALSVTDIPRVTMSINAWPKYSGRSGVSSQLQRLLHKPSLINVYPVFSHALLRPTHYAAPPSFRILFQSRTFLGFGRTNKKHQPLDPLTADFLKKKQPSNSLPPIPKKGDLAPSSIFASEPSTQSKTAKSPRHVDPTLSLLALDPQPITRKRWHRKMVIREIRQRYRLKPAVKILRTERSSLSKSHMLPTSIKKLGHLARQVAGKPVDDAIVQMRFSKKKAARDVLKHLEYARDEAIVRRGMGLGLVKKEGEGQDARKDGARADDRPFVVEKNGRKRFVRDKTQIYVDQVWVGRGTPGREPDYRARGQMNIMTNPKTSKSSIAKSRLPSIVWVRLTDQFRYFCCTQRRSHQDAVSR